MHQQLLLVQLFLSQLLLLGHAFSRLLLVHLLQQLLLLQLLLLLGADVALLSVWVNGCLFLRFVFRFSGLHSTDLGGSTLAGVLFTALCNFFVFRHSSGQTCCGRVRPDL